MFCQRHGIIIFFLVGGGASGSVIVSRLTEEPCVTVLLLEAGPEPPLLTEVPALCTYFWGSNLDWQFKTVPQKYTASGLENRVSSTFNTCLILT